MIIANNLDPNQESLVLDSLKGNKEALGLILGETIGISHIVGKHRIHFEDNVKPKYYKARRLDPNV